MVQRSENRHLAEVFTDLFDPDGAEIYLKPADGYIVPGTEIDFYTVVEAAKRREEIAIGYRVAARSGEAPAFGVVLNPDKVQPLTFGPGDQVIVLADA
jgi:hypothetical protein